MDTMMLFVRLLLFYVMLEGCWSENSAGSPRSGCAYKLYVPLDADIQCDGKASYPAALVQNLKAAVNSLQSKVTAVVLQNTEIKEALDKLKDTTAAIRGTTYVRWGRSVCPDDAQRIYKGYAAGSHYSHHGSTANYLCLPDKPQWDKIVPGHQGGSYIYGAEYEVNAYGTNIPFRKNNAHGNTIHNHDVPCALCYVKQSVAETIPAWKSCPDGWRMEYWGYMMSAHYSHKSNKVAVCVDAAPEIAEGGKANHDGALFYNLEAACGSLPCPKYIGGGEITCAVCSR